MLRDMPKRNNKKTSTHEPQVRGKYGAFCPIKSPQPPVQQPAPTPNEADILIAKYRDLHNQLQKCRGKLYVMGVNPDDYL